MNDTGKIIRPQVDEDLILHVKAKYPIETGRLNDMETLAWALNDFLSFEPLEIAFLREYVKHARQHLTGRGA